jgi:HK97 family phage major capsid protein
MGAEVAATINEITYDDVIGLYFSVKPEYRKNAVWLMNDVTALALRLLRTVQATTYGVTAMIPWL